MSVAASDLASLASKSNSLQSQGSSIGRQHLFHPIVDFFCLGGGSVLLVGILLMLGIGESGSATVAALAMGLAHVVNHPHFAHSYQLFYRDYWNKAFTGKFAPSLRLRYLFAGIAVPLLLALFMGLAVSAGDPVMLGQAANLMTFLVGWHYVKQGYGVLIALSVIRKQFFSTLEKRILLTNAYACWISFWLAINWMVTTRNLWGIEHYMLDIPTTLLIASLCVSGLSTCVLLAMLARKWLASGGKVPVNGIIAYLSTLYVWLFCLTNPLFALIIPACHSLQYLAIVWRYRLNLEAAQQEALTAGTTTKPPYSASRSFRFMVFVAVGTLLGYLGFWAVPEFLDSNIAYEKALFGSSLFLYIFWVFINVHHYFLDNVIWRRENPDTKRYLFS